MTFYKIQPWDGQSETLPENAVAISYSAYVIPLSDADAAPYIAGTKRHRMLDGRPVILSDDEEAERDAEQAVWASAQPARRFAAIEARLQAEMDKRAKADGFDDLRSAISYVGSTNLTWATQGGKYLVWRDAVWLKAYKTQEAIMADPAKNPIPSDDQAAAEMPPFPA